MANAFLLLAKGRIQLWRILQDPAIDGAVIHSETPFGHHFFNIPITKEHTRVINEHFEGSCRLENVGL